jgi:hypothetical protein
VRVGSGLLDKRVVGDRVIKRQRLFQMRPGWRKPAGKRQVITRGVVTQNEPSGIVALTAQTQQILGQALRQVEVATVYVIYRLPIGNLKEVRGRTEVLPQFSCAGIGLARFRRGEAFASIRNSATAIVEEMYLCVKSPAPDDSGGPPPRRPWLDRCHRDTRDGRAAMLYARRLTAVEVYISALFYRAVPCSRRQAANTASGV